MDFQKQIKDSIANIENKFGSEKFSNLEDLISEIKDNFDYISSIDLSKYAIMLSAFLSYIGTLLAIAEREYYLKWSDIKKKNPEMTDGKANKLAKASEQHYHRNLIAYKKESIEELIMAIKKRVDAITKEYSMTRISNKIEGL